MRFMDAKAKRPSRKIEASDNLDNTTRKFTKTIEE